LTAADFPYFGSIISTAFTPAASANRCRWFTLG